MRYTVLLFIAAVIYFCWPATYPQGNTISVVCNGQLGNQLFKIATTLSYAKDHHLKAVFPSLSNDGDNLRYNRDHLFRNLCVDETNVKLIPYVSPVINYHPLPKFGNVLLEGGFFSWKYFHHNREMLLNAFEEPDEVHSYLENKYKELLHQPNTVSVHVRTYSKATHETGLHFVGMEFFRKAMDIFPADSVFVIFTDRSNWTKIRFQKAFSDKKMVFIEGNDHITDLFLMSHMKHHILSTSTFSWWGAYLNVDANKKVIYPLQKQSFVKTWIRPLFDWMKPSFHFDEYYLPEWQAVEYQLEPYPEDINAYGDVTKSVFAGDK